MTPGGEHERVGTVERPLRLAVVGVGSWGRKVLRNAVALPGACVRVVCDRDAAALAEAAASVRGVAPRATLSSDEALADADVDAVLIATPAEEHARMARVALRAGKHVFVEKPLALSVADAASVRRAAAQAARVVMVGHVVHYDPAYVALCSATSSGAVGAITAVFGVRHTGVMRGQLPAWWMLGPHDVSLALRILGDETPRVASAARVPASDRTVAALRTRSGARAFLDIAGRSEQVLRAMVVVGAEGAAVVDATTGASRFWLHSAADPRAVMERLHSAASRGGLAEECSMVVREAAAAGPGTVDGGEPLHAELCAFVAAIRSEETFPTTVEDGEAVTRALSAVDEALASRTPAAWGPSP